jgi:hypothetical protein
MYNPLLITFLGFLCGLAVSLFALLAVWMRRKDAHLTAYQSALKGHFFAKGMVWASLCSIMSAIVAVAGAAGSTFALPHPEWTLGVLAGVGLPLGTCWLLRRNRAM